MDLQKYLEWVRGLDASWYASRPIPERLIRNLGNAPITDEIPEAGTYSVVKRREEAKLTPLESAVLILLSHGFPQREAAKTLKMSHATFRRHLKDARFALAAKSTTQAVSIALRNRLIP